MLMITQQQDLIAEKKLRTRKTVYPAACRYPASLTQKYIRNATFLMPIRSLGCSAGYGENTQQVRFST